VAEDSGLVWFGEKGAEGDLIALCSCLRRGRGEGGAELCSLGPSDRMCGKGTKLGHGRFRLGVRKHLFMERVVKPWNRLPREVVNAPSLSVVKRHLDNALYSMLSLLASPEVVRQLNWMIIVGPFQLKYSILFYSILFYSILFYSILFYSILFYCYQPLPQHNPFIRSFFT